MKPYLGIEHIDDVARFDKARDGTMMHALGRLICEAGMHEHIGVALLHIHFMDLGDKEVLIEGEEGDLVVTRPTLCQDVKSPVHPAIYRLTDNFAEIPIHWRRGDDAYAKEVLSFLAEHTPRLLRILGDEACRFGIARAPTYPKSRQDMVLRERQTPDRALVSTWARAPVENDVQTAWYFAPMMSGQECIPIDDRTFCTPFCSPMGKTHAPGHQSNPLPPGHLS